MTGSIRLHKEHGLNPTIPTCFWCGEARNEVALLGAAYRGRAPMHMTIDYDPCDKCKEEWKTGIALLEASATPNSQGQPAIQKSDYPSQESIYPTGRWWVMKRERFAEVFNISPQPRCFIDVEAVKKLGIDQIKATNERKKGNDRSK